MVTGVLFGIAACLIWGSVYVAPLVLGAFDPLFVTAARYAVFGLFSVVLLAARPALWTRFSRHDLLIAFELGVIGNLVYYGLLSEAVVRTGAAVAGAFSALIPVTCTITSNLLQKNRLPWRSLALPLSLILAGLLLVNSAEFLRLSETNFFEADADFAFGAACAALSVAVWTWFPLRNAAWLRRTPSISASDWTALQGAALLPAALLLLIPCSDGVSLDAILTPGFLFWMAVLGIGCSWLASALWCAMSRRLPSILIGQMIVFETLAAVAYGAVREGALPNAAALAGIAMLLLGITRSMQLCSRTCAEEAPEHAEHAQTRRHRA